MHFLFVHQNFPAQFKWLAPALARKGHAVTALTMRDLGTADWNGVTLRRYQPRRSSTRGIHPWAIDFETKLIRGEAALAAATALQREGLNPDAIIAHPGWGESLFLKDVWPQAKLGIYCEFFYGADSEFDPEFAPPDPHPRARTRVKNLNNVLQFQTADAGLSPTAWQASTFPADVRPRITIAHDGIDTQLLTPNAAATCTLPDGLELKPGDEVITFVSRNLEPYRGFHVFMRALPALLAQRPHAHIVIVGSDGVSYGAPAPDGKTWRSLLCDEVGPKIPPLDWNRVHFTGQLDYPRFVSLLQRSTVHVYLTYPFVLSWSLLEAMSIGCAIVASDTAPVREAIQHGHTGLLTDFFDAKALADSICRLADDPSLRATLGANARASAITRYDLSRVCLPAQLHWAESLLG